MSIMALICFVLASIPRLLTRNPRSCPAGTPKTHLLRLSFYLHFCKFVNVSCKSSIRSSGSLVLITTSTTYASVFLLICSPRHVWIAL